MRFAYFLFDNNLRLRSDAASRLRNNIQAMRDNDPIHYIKKKEQRISGLFINTLLILNYASACREENRIENKLAAPWLAFQQFLKDAPEGERQFTESNDFLTRAREYPVEAGEFSEYEAPWARYLLLSLKYFNGREKPANSNAFWAKAREDKTFLDEVDFCKMAIYWSRVIYDARASNINIVFDGMTQRYSLDPFRMTTKTTKHLRKFSIAYANKTRASVFLKGTTPQAHRSYDRNVQKESAPGNTIHGDAPPAPPIRFTPAPSAVATSSSSSSSPTRKKRKVAKRKSKRCICGLAKGHKPNCAFLAFLREHDIQYDKKHRNRQLDNYLKKINIVLYE